MRDFLIRVVFLLDFEKNALISRLSAFKVFKTALVLAQLLLRSVWQPLSGRSPVSLYLPY